jgi:hypothetical protein
MKNFVRLLPDEIINLISNFLLCTEDQNKSIFKFPADSTNFCNVNVYFVAKKRRSRLVVLKAIYADKLRRSSKFRERVSRTINDPVRQLEMVHRIKNPSDLTLVDEQYLNGIGRIVLYSCKISSLSTGLTYLSLTNCVIDCKSFPVINTVHLDSCDHFGKRHSIDVGLLNIVEEASFKSMKLMNYHALGHLKSLSIYYCESIIDVSCFRNIPTLLLAFCPNISDVSSLGRVHDLTLQGCPKVADVSSLGNVYNLTLSALDNICDVCALGNVHTLKFIKMKYVTDLSSLKNVYELHFNEFRGSDISGLKNILKLHINNSPNIVDISMLKTVKCLYVMNCLRITHFHGLERIKELSVGDDDKRVFTMSSGIGLFDRLSNFSAFKLILESDQAIHSHDSVYGRNSRTSDLFPCMTVSFELSPV